MSTRSRDAALRRLALLNRWLAVAAVILTLAFSVVVAHAFPGHSITKTPARTAPAQRSTTARRRARPHHQPAVHHHSGPTPENTQTTTTQTTAAQTTTAPITPTQAPVAATPPTESQPAPVVSGGS